MSFALYMFGLAVLLAGIAWGLVTAGLAMTYVVIACLVVGGIGIMMAVSRTRAKIEAATQTDTAAGCQVLLQAMVERANA